MPDRRRAAIGGWQSALQGARFFYGRERVVRRATFKILKSLLSPG